MSEEQRQSGTDNRVFICVCGDIFRGKQAYDDRLCLEDCEDSDE